MKNIVFTRIDDRLIHGQVMTSWLNYTGANKIMVIDDQVAADTFMKGVLKSLVPANIALAVFSVEDAITRLKKGFQDKDRVLILVKFPKTLLCLMEGGIAFTEVNVGGMGVSGMREKFYKNISATPEERDIFKKMIAMGCTISIQIIAEDHKVNVEKLV